MIVTSPLDREFFSGRECFEFAPESLFSLVDALDREGPGFADVAAVRAQFAVDGVIEPDWSRALSDVREVIVLARVGGG